MPQVKLFGILRRYAGSPQLELPGTTVRAVLEALCAMNTELCAAIRDENGLRQYVRAMLNGHDVELAQGLDTPLAPNDEIAIFPPIAGG
jgi:molybdopterin synthase sulfur carrier subunit